MDSILCHAFFIVSDIDSRFLPFSLFSYPFCPFFLSFIFLPSSSSLLSFSSPFPFSFPPLLSSSLCLFSFLPHFSLFSCSLFLVSFPALLSSSLLSLLSLFLLSFPPLFFLLFFLRSVSSYLFLLFIFISKKMAASSRLELDLQGDSQGGRVHKVHQHWPSQQDD